MSGDQKLGLLGQQGDQVPDKKMQKFLRLVKQYQWELCCFSSLNVIVGIISILAFLLQQQTDIQDLDTKEKGATLSQLEAWNLLDEANYIFFYAYCVWASASAFSMIMVCTRVKAMIGIYQFILAITLFSLIHANINIHQLGNYERIEVDLEWYYDRLYIDVITILTLLLYTSFLYSRIKHINAKEEELKDYQTQFEQPQIQQKQKYQKSNQKQQNKDTEGQTQTSQKRLQNQL